MSGRFLLDTNVAIRLLGDDADVKARSDGADDAIVCTIVLGELLYGAYKSRAVKKNLARVQELAGGGSVLVCDEQTADEYGLIKNALRAKGRPIPDNDIWIAALAKQHNLVLATRDAHFAQVDGLTLERW